MAPLIMVTLLTVSSLFFTCGCFLRVERSFSEDFPPLSLACGWSLGANGSLSCEWEHLHKLRVEGPSGARKGGRTDPRSGPGRPAWANRPRPIPARFGRSFAPMGPHVFMHFAPSTCTIFMMSFLRPRWRFSLHEIWSLRFNPWGCYFVVLQSLPPFGVISSSS
jgi:hypothetical protein